RAYWGVSHRLLIEDFYDRIANPGPFWISPREAAKTLQIIDQLYSSSGAAVTRSTGRDPSQTKGQ
uniref:hypothetical protein n=1 Tax=Streptobacillus moniliformis TaxID=34105 RepID=UPI0018C88EBA